MFVYWNHMLYMVAEMGNMHSINCQTHAWNLQLWLCICICFNGKYVYIDICMWKRLGFSQTKWSRSYIADALCIKGFIGLKCPTSRKSHFSYCIILEIIRFSQEQICISELYTLEWILFHAWELRIAIAALSETHARPEGVILSVPKLELGRGCKLLEHKN